jgi:hypothetical protein
MIEPLAWVPESIRYNSPMAAQLVNSEAPRKTVERRMARRRTEWVEAVTALADDVAKWASDHAARFNWSVECHDERLSEVFTGGEYTVPVVEMRVDVDKLVLEPIARRTLGAEGRVDLYAWPRHYRVMLLHQKDGSWIVRTDSGLDWPSPWNEATFVQLAEGLLKAE